MHLYFNGPRSVFLQVAAVKNQIPQPEISYGSVFSTKVRMNKTQFGDGYTQRALNGINTEPLTLNANFTKRTLEVVTEIDKFLRGDDVFYARKANEYFYYIPPPPYNGGAIEVPRKFICESWEVGGNEHNGYSLTAVWEETFDP